MHGAATLSGGLFQNNRSSSWGGGLYANSTLALTGTQFLSNTATSRGGGAYADGAATLSGGLFQNNQSTSCGRRAVRGQHADADRHAVHQQHCQRQRRRVISSGYLGRRTFGQRAFCAQRRQRQRFGPVSWLLRHVVILHTTIASPTVGAGAAIYVNAGTVNITNTIVASYTIGISSTGGTVTSDYNLFFNAPTSRNVTGSHSLTGTNPPSSTRRATTITSRGQPGD